MVKKNKSLKNYSPLRYPGGKTKISPFVKLLIKQTNIANPIYVEPFAGGAGVALRRMEKAKANLFETEQKIFIRIGICNILSKSN